MMQCVIPFDFDTSAMVLNMQSWQRTKRLIVGSSAGAVLGGAAGVVAVAAIPPLTLLVAVRSKLSSTTSMQLLLCITCLLLHMCRLP